MPKKKSPSWYTLKDGGFVPLNRTARKRTERINKSTIRPVITPKVGKWIIKDGEIVR